MSQALEGVRVIDMTHNQAGPACAQMLGFLGAEVIKLEEPKGGDIARAQNDDELFFLAFNSNKRSLTLNLKSDEAKALFRKIIAQSDVLIENFGPGALDRLGLGWKDLQKINPRLIFATIKGFGTYGPHAHEELRADRTGDGWRHVRHRLRGRTVSRGVHLFGRWPAVD